MPKRGENIYKRKDGRYEGRYVKSIDASTGKVKYGYVYDRVYREIKEKLRQMQVEGSRPDKGGKDTLAAWLDYWLFQICAIQVKDSTLSRYYSIIHNHILPNLGATMLMKLTGEQIQALLNEKLRSGKKDGGALAAKTVRDTYSLLNSALEYAVETGKLMSNPCRYVKLPQNTYESMRVLDRPEQRILEEHIQFNRSNITLGILLCLYSGIRIGELCAVQWKDISFQNATLSITKTIKRVKNFDDAEQKTILAVGSPKTKASVRTILLPTSMMNILKKCPNSNANAYVVTGSEKFCDTRLVQHHFSRIIKKCGIQQANFHALRHTYATRMIELGVDARTLSELLGHANPSITLKCYVHSFAEHKKNAVEKLNGIFMNKPSNTWFEI